jgi:hypothetical protein
MVDKERKLNDVSLLHSLSETTFEDGTPAPPPFFMENFIVAAVQDETTEPPTEEPVE